MDTNDLKQLEDLARLSRRWSLKAITEAKSGHPGGSLSCTEILIDLYFRTLKHDPANPSWDERDRFILSKGHAAPSLYATLGLAGYYPVEEMLSLRKLGSKFQGHPDTRFFPLAEASTGSLGQGLSIGIGTALAAGLSGSSYHTYVLLGDGECQEGQIWEAAMYAGFLGLKNLTAIVDFNHFQLDDATEKILDMEPFLDKWRSCKWSAIKIDGHNFSEINQALSEARDNDRPTIIMADTVKGKGVSFVEGNNDFHGKPLTLEQLSQALEELGGPDDR